MAAPTRLEIPLPRRTMEGYLAVPEAAGRRPAVIVIHEIFGPDRHIQDVARRFAAEGFVALAPNLFTGEIQSLLTPAAVASGFAFLRSLPPEVQRDPARVRASILERPEGERRLLEALGRIQDPAEHARFAEDLVGVAEYLRGLPTVDPDKVTSVGFCFGGGMSGRLATLDPRLAAAVIFYGSSPPADDLPRVRCPLLGLYGGEDARITDTVPALEGAARRLGISFTHRIYPGAPHAFFNDTRPTYRPDAAHDAWVTVLDFLRVHTGRRPSFDRSPPGG